MTINCRLGTVPMALITIVPQGTHLLQRRVLLKQLLVPSLEIEWASLSSYLYCALDLAAH